MFRRLTFILSLSLLFADAMAQVPAEESALATTFQDPQLQWGPCPPFLPEGCAIAILHGDPAQDNLDIFFKVPGKSTIPLHWHTSPERMILIEGQLSVTYDGQESSVLLPGSYAYGPAKKPHLGTCESTDPCVLFIAFESSLDAVPVENTTSQ